MKFSYQWLSELVPGLDMEPAELERLITMKTAECEGVSAYGAFFPQVQAARVLSVEPMPKGKNKALVIDTGIGGHRRVVCGAENVRPGLVAPWVPPGTALREKTIGVAWIDGFESEGMLASAAELDISRDHAGLLELEDVQPGQSLDRLHPDWIVEIDNKSLTHRPDLWGHYGMAREVSAITGRALQDPVDLAVLPQAPPTVQVVIEDYSLCPRYSALQVDNIAVGPSPLWLQARLESVGLNTISNIVDITNFVLAELPQPMHAFDAGKLRGNTIFVRRARAGESLKALNGETYDLTTADLVIADEAGPIAIAGVIGGADSAISESTTRVVFESANFQASSVRLTSSRHKLRTDASMRFEKSLDPENTVRGLARAVALLREVSPQARAVGGVTDARSAATVPAPISLPVRFVQRKLGKDISQAGIEHILNALGFGVNETAPPELLVVTVPSWRATKDISLKDDLVEEIGRMVGYGEITPAPPLVASVVPPANPMRTFLRSLRRQFAAQGFTEVHNYSFVTEADAERFSLPVVQHLAVRNPIASELTHLRCSLLPGLFNNIVSNVRHFSEVRTFEIGNEIHPTHTGTLPHEIPHAAAVLFNVHGNEEDFFEMKRVLESLLPGARVAATEPKPYEHPVRTAQVEWRESMVGRIFELHPALLMDAGVDGRAAMLDLDLAMVQSLSASAVFHYQTLRRYPTSGFDLSVIAGQLVPVAQIEDELRRLGGPAIALIEFVRQYSGPPLSDGQKSVSYHIEVGASDRTLTTEEAGEIRNTLIAGMRDLGYELRV